MGQANKKIEKINTEKKVEINNADKAVEKNNAEKTVEIINLKKRYSSNAPLAVDDISFETYEGEIVGVLGQNGAGKTTTLKCMTGMLPITSGDIKICGFSIKTEPKKAKANFGFVTDNHAVFEKMTGIEYVNFMANIYRVPLAERQTRLDAFQESLNLGDAIFNEISSYSHGMKQKISIMGALIHHPRVWVLDEPMTGLDPQTSHEVKELMFRHRDSNNTVLFSSHNLDAVERLCDRVYVINHGKLIDSIIMKDFKENHQEGLESYFFNLITASKADKAVVE
ncbi:MAG: ABC transporter ATP-binding protein [Clostridia bacterium]